MCEDCGNRRAEARKPCSDCEKKKKGQLAESRRTLKMRAAQALERLRRGPT